MMTVKVFTLAHLPEALVQAWLQHMRDFDAAHPGCHFEVLGDASEMSIGEMVEALRVNPALDITGIIKRRRP